MKQSTPVSDNLTMDFTNPFYAIGYAIAIKFHSRERDADNYAGKFKYEGAVCYTPGNYSLVFTETATGKTHICEILDRQAREVFADEHYNENVVGYAMSEDSINEEFAHFLGMTYEELMDMWEQRDNTVEEQSGDEISKFQNWYFENYILNF